MTATFTNNPENSARDLVRILVGDTNTDSPQLTDETIAWALADKPNTRLAAASCAEIIATGFAGQASKKQVGDLQIWYESKANEYRSMAKALRLDAVSAAKPYTGGISVSVKSAARTDTDWDQPAFARGMMDNPSATSTSTGGY